MVLIPLDTRALRRRTLEARLDAYLAGLGQGFNPGPARRTAVRELQRLDALSDAELGALGLRRPDVTAHVVRRVWGA